MTVPSKKLTPKVSIVLFSPTPPSPSIEAQVVYWITLVQFPFCSWKNRKLYNEPMCGNTIEKTLHSKDIQQVLCLKFKCSVSVTLVCVFFIYSFNCVLVSVGLKIDGQSQPFLFFFFLSSSWLFVAIYFYCSGLVIKYTDRSNCKKWAQDLSVFILQVTEKQISSDFHQIIINIIHIILMNQRLRKTRICSPTFTSMTWSLFNSTKQV